MAGVRFTVQSPSTATGAATKKTHLQIVAPAQQRVLVSEWNVSFDGEDPTAKPALVELILQSTAGTGGDVCTPGKVNTGDDETLQTTALSAIDGTQPTETVVLHSELVHPQGGYTWQAPQGQPYVCKGGQRLGIAITVDDTVNARTKFTCEE